MHNLDKNCFYEQNNNYASLNYECDHDLSKGSQIIYNYSLCSNDHCFETMVIFEPTTTAVKVNSKHSTSSMLILLSPIHPSKSTT